MYLILILLSSFKNILYNTANSNRLNYYPKTDIPWLTGTTVQVPSSFSAHNRKL